MKITALTTIQGEVSLADEEGPVVPYCGDLNCTHVIADRLDEAHVQQAKQGGKTIVTLLWLFECVESQKLLPSDSEPVGTPHKNKDHPAW